MKFSAHILNHSVQYAMPEEIDYLKELTGSYGSDHHIVMIGAGPGVMGLAVLEDNWRCPKFSVIDINPNLFDYMKAHMEAAEILMENVRFITGDSHGIGLNAWDKPVDLLIVDGDHSFEGVQRDIEAWFPHVKSGGYIFFHDVLEREGGFNGEGIWKPGGVAKAIAYSDLPWTWISNVGISSVYKKD